MGEGLPAGAGVGGRGAKKPLLRSESTEDVQRAYPPPQGPWAPANTNANVLRWKAF